MTDKEYNLDLKARRAVSAMAFLTLNANEFSGYMTPLAPKVHICVNQVIEDSQDYYWTTEWQAVEAQSRLDYTEGRYRSFTDAAAALAWLDSEDY